MNPVNFDLLKGLFSGADTNIEADVLTTVQSIQNGVLGETILLADIKLAATKGAP